MYLGSRQYTSVPHPSITYVWETLLINCNCCHYSICCCVEEIAQDKWTAEALGPFRLRDVATLLLDVTMRDKCAHDVLQPITKTQ